MGLVNRLAALVVMAGLLVLGLVVALAAAGVLDFALSDFPIASWSEQGSAYLEAVIAGGLRTLGVAILGGLILLGLILAVVALWPERSRRLSLGEDAFVSRSVVRDEVESAALATRGVLDARARFRGSDKRPHLVVSAATRRGEDRAELRERVREKVRKRVEDTGVPIADLDVRLRAEDPRRLKARVR